jgi:hypothetical protein
VCWDFSPIPLHPGDLAVRQNSQLWQDRISQLGQTVREVERIGRVVVHSVHRSVTGAAVLQDRGDLSEATAFKQQPELVQIEQLFGRCLEFHYICHVINALMAFGRILKNGVHIWRLFNMWLYLVINLLMLRSVY